MLKNNIIVKNTKNWRARVVDGPCSWRTRTGMKDPNKIQSNSIVADFVNRDQRRRTRTRVKVKIRTIDWCGGNRAAVSPSPKTTAND